VSPDSDAVGFDLAYVNEFDKPTACVRKRTESLSPSPAWSLGTRAVCVGVFAWWRGLFHRVHIPGVFPRIDRAELSARRQRPHGERRPVESGFPWWFAITRWP